jgi:2-polyprenyl-6-methoxyphenol hydroxylase-like FAD-dependent oxidoreductase
MSFTAQNSDNEKSAEKSSCDHAIVVGGSIAGLLTARVLANHFSQVTVVERDLFAPDPRPRPGVPQSRHIHALLPRGLQIVEKFFPGICADLQGSGAVPLDIGNDVAWLTPQGWGVKFPSGIEALSFTRDLLDHAVCRFVGQLHNVTVMDGREVLGLLRAESGHIVGVRTRQRNVMLDPGHEENLLADLTVVATGRLHTIAKWFGEVGLTTPEATTINAHIGYASRICRPPKNNAFPWKALIIQAAPPATQRSGLVFPIEGNRWLITLIGADRDYPPADDAGFLEFARNLRNPRLFEAIRDAEPLTPVYSYRATENRQHHFHRIANWPAGLIITGDAACAFNPVYGQGMTTAAIEAERLGGLLSKFRNRMDLGAIFQQKLAATIRGPWILATSADLRFRSVEGAKRTWQTRTMHWYVDRVLRLGTRSVWARRRFLEVQGMLRDASAILRPDMLLRVLLDVLRIKLPRRKAAELKMEWSSLSHPADHQWPSGEHTRKVGLASSSKRQVKQESIA